MKTTNSNFKVIPAIDVYKNGELVRLEQGDFNRVQRQYTFSLEEKVLDYLNQGARNIHTIDLAGAEDGVPVNTELFKKLGQTIRAFEKEFNTKVTWQVGGGARTKEDVARVLTDYKADLLILGGAAIDKELESGFLSELVKEFGGEKFIIDIAVGYSSNDKTKKVLKKNGWRDDVTVPFAKALALLKGIGITKTLVTAKELDGMDQGPGFELGNEVKSFGFEVILSGGVATAAQCAAAMKAGLDGVVVGKALLDEKISLSEINEALN